MAYAAPRNVRRTDERAVRAPLVASAQPDLWLFATVAALVCIGLVMIYSASNSTAYNEFHDTAYFLKKQAAWLVVALVCGGIAFKCDYRKLRALAPAGIVFALVTNALVLNAHLGMSAGGSRRWLGAGALSFQPSEVAKLALVLYLASALTAKGERVRSFSRGLFPVLLITLALAMLVLKEPDMGTASLLVFTAFAVLFCAGARIEHLGVTALALVPPIALIIGSSAYKRARIFAFLDPWKDPQNTGFHIVQSLFALGSGGITGLGLGASRQKFSYLPEQYTDFIFAIIGEELGLLGTATVVILFGFFAFRAVRIALAAPDRFGFLLVCGCVCTIVVQAFVNIGVVTSSWPVTGVPLPFVSFGGSSLVVNIVCAALIINVGRYRAALR
jgi:cell division protein FtsW